MVANLACCGLLWIVTVVHCTQALRYIVTVPNTLRFGVEETVGLSVSEAAHPVEVQIYLQDHPGRRNIFSSQTLRVANGQPKMATVTVQPNNIPELQRNDSKLMVYLIVKPTKGEFPAKEALVPIRKYSGYIFIQTDKPLYLPNQQVQIRILSLDEKMLPSKEPFTLEIQNPDSIRVMYKDVQPEAKGITETHFKFSSSPMFGNWTITVHYGYKQSAKTSIKFEVKEYVLPTFFVHIDPPKIILSNDNEIRGRITARYVYGKPVQGTLNLKFQIHTKDEFDIPIGVSKYIKLKEGQHDFTIKVEENIKKKGLLWFPAISGSIFIVEAEVVEQATGNRETAIDSSSVFTTSPYKITFSRSLKDFKPGVPYQVQADVHYATGEPLKERIEVKVDSAVATRGGATIRDLLKHPKLITDERGRVMFQFDTDHSDQQLQITMKTADEGTLDENQAVAKLRVVRYVSPVPNSYVWISSPQDEITFKVGKTFQTSVTVYPANASTSLYYMVVSRGAIVLFDEILSEGSNLVRTVQFPVTAVMSPSPRLIVFIIKDGKVIADSMLLEVEKTCNYNNGKPFHLDAQTSSGVFTPGQQVNLEIRGEPDSYVGLTAVDEALYALNKRHLLSPRTMFSEMDSHDLGCGPGGGENTEAVFRNAGVLILSNVEIGDHTRKADDCNPQPRLKRDVHLSIVEDYTGFAQECCKYGLLEGPENMTCADRAKLIYDADFVEKENCSQAYLDCCQRQITFLAARSSVHRTGGQKGNEISSTEELINMFEGDTLRSIRRFFPETWFFNTIQIGSPECKNKDQTLGVCRLPFIAPHSITTWKVQAVGISETTGMCVAEPLRIPVFKPMFIQLDLPYAAVRGEQIEVPATIFNYGNVDFLVSVYMFGVEGVCMGASDGERSEIRKIQVPANGAKTVTFPVVPLRVTEHALRVVALSSAGSDAVEKTLRVVAEGVQKEVTRPLVLDPTGFYRRRRRREHDEGITEIFDEEAHKQTISVDLGLPDNHIPGTGKCVLSVIGNVVGQAIVTSLSGVEQKFIKLPTGCGEQAMIHLAPLVYTMLYLKRSNQMTSSAETKGYQFMEQGYSHQLKYRQKDGSFSVWTSGYVSSTWLTAFVARVFCQADVFIRISKDISCGAVDWFLTRQRDTGAFYDAYKVHHREMTGGVQGDVTMTAFVLIAMQECSQCDSSDKRLAVSRAVNFLENHIDFLTRPYAVAITAYALKLASSVKADEAVQKLKDISVYDENTFTRKWGVDASEFGGGSKPWIYQHRPDAVAVETTGYALLTMVLNDDLEYSHPIANWLNQQRSSSGSFVSTQDTVIALQALAEYSAKALIPPLDMVCNVTSQVRGKRSIVLKRHNALVLQEEELPAEGKLIVIAQGKGLASMSVALQYNVEQRPEEKCKYDITIKLSEYKDRILPAQPRPVFKPSQRIPQVVLRSITSKKEYSKLGYQMEDEEDSDPLIRGGAVLQGSSSHVVGLEICVRYQSNKPSKMSILDIGLFTGYKPHKPDLRNLTDHKQLTKVSHYEMSDRSVILYLEEVPNVTPHCLKLRATQEIAVGKVQPTAVKIYNYYEPDEACTKFYRPDGNNAEMQQICEGRHCVCVEGACPKCEPFKDIKTISRHEKRYDKLVEMACENHHFVWRVKFVKSYIEGSFKYYEMEVLDVLKEGLQSKEDVEGIGTMLFASRIACACPEMQPEEEYVVMGNDGFQYKTEDGEIMYKYVFDKATTVYHTQAIRFKPKNEQPLQKSFNTLIKRLANVGCPD